MPFVITDPCIETKDTACVDVCPVDCIHPRKDEAEFATATMLYIHPEESHVAAHPELLAIPGKERAAAHS
jgi:NAD-dependent dihydropyrimidine dehydrogenase PreA subunit